MTDPDGRKVGATYLRNNLDKRSVGIDLKAPEGRELFLALAANFDVIAENFKPGTMDRMGLGYDDIAAVYPHVIYVSISGFGNSVETPYRDWPAYASIVEAMSGIYDYRHPERPPVTIPVGALGDICSALFGVIGILAALRHRDHTGEGQYVDIAMFDAMIAMTDIVTNFWSLGVRPEPDKGLEVICEGFRASDGYVVVQIVREHQFATLADLVGHPEWKTTRGSRPVRDGCRASSGDPARGRGVVVAAHEARSGARSSPRPGSSRGRAITPSDVIADPHVAARHMLVEMPRTDGVADPVLVPGNPVKLSKVGEGPETRVPWVGEHTAAVLKESSASTPRASRRSATPASSTAEASVRGRFPPLTDAPALCAGCDIPTVQSGAWTSTSRRNSAPSPRRSRSSSTRTTTPRSST